MKKLIGIALLSSLVISCTNESTTGSAGVKHSLEKKWETDTVLKVPESVLFDSLQHILFVSNIDGAPWGNDSTGSIGKVGLDGTIINAEWVTGLSAPKGMGLYNGKLYVADMTNMVVIDTASGTIEKKVPIPGSEGLNDVTIDKNGIVYISDSKQFKVFRVENDSAAIYLGNLQGPNGVLATGDVLYVLDKGSLLKIDAAKSLTKISEGLEGNTDGVESINGSDFLVSGWSGTLWYVHADGSKDMLLDTRKEEINTADIGFDPATKTVYVPTFNKKSVVAYEVK